MRYAFADFEVDLQLFELRRGGQRVHVEPKVFDLLVFLIEHADRVVTKRELLDAVWPGEHVVEAVLPTAVRRLRTALGQDSTADTPIATERGRGYRFAAPLRRISSAVMPAVIIEGPVTSAAPAPATSMEPPRSAISTSQSPDARGPSPAFSPRERGTDVVTLHDEEPLIGRAPEVEELVRVLDSAMLERRRPRMRLVCGPPGVGLTRLLSELLELAHSRRLPAFSTRGRVGAPELWPWSSLVRQIVDGLDEAMRNALPKPLRRELNLIAPALRSGDSLPPAPPAQPRSPLVVADAVRSLLALVSPDTAALLVLDDLDQLDAASLEVVRALAEAETQRPLLLVSVREPLARDGAPSLLVQGLERGERVERMRLAPLTPEQTRAYLRAARGKDVPEDVARHVHRLTAGLPAVLRACTRAWPEHALDNLRDALLLRLPPIACEPSRRWLSALPDESAALLRVAAVLGERFDLGLLRAVSGLDAERVLGVLEQAVELSILEPDDAQPQAYRFALGYLRDAFYDELRPVERRPLHRAAAEALERRLGVTADGVDTLLLAHHFWNALPAVPVSKVVQHNVHAGEQLARSGRWSDAVIHYGRALEALAYETPHDLRATAELLLSLGLAQREAGDGDAAKASFEQALQLTGRLPDAEELTARLRKALGAG
jgi:DNA-binding winged helix-turn-helix (wHTH) protein